MSGIIPIILIGGGLISIFYIRSITKNNVTEMKFMKTKTIAELKEMFNQMDENGLGDNYREYVELKGKVHTKNVANTPFSDRDVAYCESKLYHVTEEEEEYKDSNGQYRTRIRKKENIISDEKSSQEIEMIDDSSEEVFLDINATGCKLDIPKTFDRLEQKQNLRNYRYFNTFSLDRYRANTIGFRMVEETIELDQNLYVIGEAFRIGKDIHIGRSNDTGKPFIVTTKSEEDVINSANQKATIALIGGIIAIILGIALLVL